LPSLVLFYRSPELWNLLQFKTYLPERCLRFVVSESSNNFIEWEAAVDNRLQAISRYCLDHIVLIGPATYGYTTDANLIREDRRYRQFCSEASQYADEGYMSARSAGFDRLH